jgi:restriction system protein
VSLVDGAESQRDEVIDAASRGRPAGARLHRCDGDDGGAGSDTLVAYVLTNRCDAPREIMISGGWGTRTRVRAATPTIRVTMNGMSRYWVIAPFESNPPDAFDRVWQFDLANNLVSIGWSELGDISNVSREKLGADVATRYSDKPRGTQALYANMLWNFYHEIAPGDVVVARRGRKALAALGKVTQRALFAPNKNPYAKSHPNFLQVAWQEQPRDKLFQDIVFPMHTLSELSADQYAKLLQGSPPPQFSMGEPVEDPTAFVLEKYLEEFIVSNFDAIFKGALRIHRDADGNFGQQYTTDIGPIDILAVEAKTNSVVIIELKKGRPSDQVVGQILRYMGWVKEHLCDNGQAVKGLVICRDPDAKLSYALKMTNGIAIRYYNVSFKLHEGAL